MVMHHFFYQFCSSSYISFTLIRSILGPQETCLESLGFDYVGSYKDFFGIVESNEYLKPMPSFVNFNCLRVFKIAMLFLQKTDSGIGRHNLINLFPPTIETLHLTRVNGCFVNVLEAVEHLLVHKSPEQIPLLKKLVLEETRCFEGRPDRSMDVLWRDTQESAVERLAWVAAAQGVSLEVIGIDDEELTLEWIFESSRLLNWLDGFDHGFPL